MAEDDDTSMDDGDESGLSKKKIAAGAALGMAVPAAVGVARKLLSGHDGSGSEDDEDDGEDDEDGDDSSEPMSRGRSESSSSTARKPRSTAKKATTKARSATPKARAASNRTREQLYKQAARLKIEGRSSMNKAQLERAIARAKSK